VFAGDMRVAISVTVFTTSSLTVCYLCTTDACLLLLLLLLLLFLRPLAQSRRPGNLAEQNDHDGVFTRTLEGDRIRFLKRYILFF